jgi:YD repeat-containing protein
MAQLTYLDIVNKVLTKLREDTVTSVDYNDYSALIGEFVNDAKKEVESAWEWSVLRTAVSFNSSIGVRTYSLSSSTNEDSRLVYDENQRPMAFDVTAGTQIQLYEYIEDRLQREYLLQYPVQTIEQPAYFSLTQLGTGFQVNFLETPSAVRNYTFYFIVPQEELSNDVDTCSVPWRPVRDLALMFALDERGEEIGEPGGRAERRFHESLANAIAIDSKKDPHKLVFYA